MHKIKLALSFSLFCLSFITFAPQTGFAGEPPVVITGPVPAMVNSYAVGSAQTFIYTVRNNVQGISFPISTSGISGPVVRITQPSLIPDNDCKEALKPGPSICTIRVQIKPTVNDSGQTFNQIFAINYQGRSSFVDNISFEVPIVQ